METRSQKKTGNDDKVNTFATTQWRSEGNAGDTDEGSTDGKNTDSVGVRQTRSVLKQAGEVGASSSSAREGVKDQQSADEGEADGALEGMTEDKSTVSARQTRSMSRQNGSDGAKKGIKKERSESSRKWVKGVPGLRSVVKKEGDQEEMRFGVREVGNEGDSKGVKRAAKRLSGRALKRRKSRFSDASDFLATAKRNESDRDDVRTDLKTIGGKRDTGDSFKGRSRKGGRLPDSQVHGTPLDVTPSKREGHTDAKRGDVGCNESEKKPGVNSNACEVDAIEEEAGPQDTGASTEKKQVSVNAGIGGVASSSQKDRTNDRKKLPIKRVTRSEERSKRRSVRDQGNKSPALRAAPTQSDKSPRGAPTFSKQGNVVGAAQPKGGLSDDRADLHPKDAEGSESNQIDYVIYARKTAERRLEGSVSFATIDEAIEWMNGMVTKAWPHPIRSEHEEEVMKALHLGMLSCYERLVKQREMFDRIWIDMQRMRLNADSLTQEDFDMVNQNLLAERARQEKIESLLPGARNILSVQAEFMDVWSKPLTEKSGPERRRDNH